MSKRSSLPPSPHVDHLRKQAKDLLSAHKRGEPEACLRIKENLPRLFEPPVEQVAGTRVSLQEVQHVIAQEYGYENWALLVKYVVATGGTSELKRVWKNYRSAIPVTVGWIGQDGSNDPCGGGEDKDGGTTTGGRKVAVP